MEIDTINPSDNFIETLDKIRTEIILRGAISFELLKNMENEISVIKDRLENRKAYLEKG